MRFVRNINVRNGSCTARVLLIISTSDTLIIMIKSIEVKIILNYRLRAEERKRAVLSVLCNNDDFSELTARTH